jgi:hypothetical protein
VFTDAGQPKKVRFGRARGGELCGAKEFFVHLKSDAGDDALAGWDGGAAR